MSILNTNYTTNSAISYLSATLSNSNKVLQSAPNVYLGPKYTVLPGMTNVFFAPCELYRGIKASYRAYKIGDYEGIFENGLRIVQAPLSFGYSVLQLFWNVIYGGIFLKIIKDAGSYSILDKASSLSASITIVGFALCAIEGVLETLGLVRTVRFFEKYYPLDAEESTQLERLKKLHFTYFQIAPKKMLKIDKYVQNKLANYSIEEQQKRKEQIIQANYTMKKSELIRRVHPWLANQIEATLPQLLQDLQSTEHSKITEAKEKAAFIFEHIKIQSQKKLLIHGIGLGAVLVTVAGLIAGCFTCPFVIPFVILVMGGVMSFIRYYLHSGLMDSEGWHFSVSNCIPGIFKIIYEKLRSATRTDNSLRRQSAHVSYISYALPGSQVEIARRNYKQALANLIPKKPQKLAFGYILQCTIRA